MSDTKHIPGPWQVDADLLDELRKAHQIIRNALAVMTPEQKYEWVA